MKRVFALIAGLLVCLNGAPGAWSAQYPHQAFEVADEMYMLTWYEQHAA